MKSKNIIIAAIAALCPIGAAAIAPTGDVRIAWDYSTMQEITSLPIENRGYIENNLIYPRIKRLSNGELMMSFMNNTYGWEPYVAISSDNGKSWHNVQRLQDQKPGKSSVGADTLIYVNPDFIELNDGRIMLAYQCRWKKGYNDLEHTNENCFIEIMTSDDKGRTWSDARRIYTGRCWEPAMLQLPSGEIQMYITDSNDVKYKRSQPGTIVIRSFDGGKTWQGKKSCSYKDGEIISRTIDERGSYDGMPSAVILDDGTLAMPLEVWSGVLKMDQTPVIVTTDKQTNWKSDQSIRQKGGPDYPHKRQLHKDLQAYGPYICRLPSGEPIVLASGKYKGNFGMWALIGDKNADNFNHATSPFQGYWGCIDYIGDNKVLACGTFDYKDSYDKKRHMIHTAIGRINRSKNISKGVLTHQPIKDFNRESNDYWFVGAKDKSCSMVNFGYDDNSLNVSNYVFDDDILAFTPENSDGTSLLIARPKANGSYDVYKFVANANGKYDIYREVGSSWVKTSNGEIPVEIAGTVNQKDDTDTGYSFVAKIPWTEIGGAPSRGEVLRIHPRHHFKTTQKESPVAATIEDAAGENPDYPSEWLKVTLN